MSKKTKRMALNPLPDNYRKRGPVARTSTGPSGPGMTMHYERMVLPELSVLKAMTVAALRGLAVEMRVETKTKDRKDEIIDKLVKSRA